MEKSKKYYFIDVKAEDLNGPSSPIREAVNRSFKIDVKNKKIHLSKRGITRIHNFHHTPIGRYRISFDD